MAGQFPDKDRDREYVAGGISELILSLYKRVLPRYIDDLERDFGPDLYPRMMRDPAVSSSVNTLKLATLADGITIEPAITVQAGAKPDPETDAKAAKAAEYADFIRRAFDGLEDEGDGILDVAWELLDGLVHGHKVAEIVLRDGEGEDAGRWVLDALRPKSSANLGFVVDPAYRLLGLTVVKQDGSTTPEHGTMVAREEQLKGFVPREKFVIFRWGGKNGDPRGDSWLWPAYDPWWLKCNVSPDYYKYLRQFGTPLLVGKTPPDGPPAVPLTDANGEVMTDDEGGIRLTTEEEKLLSTLLLFQGSSVMAIPGGAEVELISSEGEGQGFLNANDYFNREIAMAILGTTRATMEAEHGSRADSNVAQDVLGLRVSAIRRRLAVALRYLIRLLIRLNFGKDALPLAPKISLATVEQQDQAKMIAAISQGVAAGWIHRSMWPSIRAALNLPEADAEAEAADLEDESMQNRMAAGITGKLNNPRSKVDEEDEEEVAE